MSRKKVAANEDMVKLCVERADQAMDREQIPGQTTLSDALLELETERPDSELKRSVLDRYTGGILSQAQIDALIAALQDAMGAPEITHTQSVLDQISEEERRIDKMFTYAKGFFHGAKMTQSLDALTYMRTRHAGQTRKSGESYIVHPLRMACTAMALGIQNDNLMATILIHDVVEDTGVSVNDLPFNDKVRRSVKYMTIREFKDEPKSVTKRRYYRELLEDPDALICKGFDRRDNLATMTELSKRAIVKNILETNLLLMPMMKEAKEKWPNLSNTLYILRSDIKHMNNLLAHCYGVDQNDWQRLINLLDDPNYMPDIQITEDMKLK